MSQVLRTSLFIVSMAMIFTGEYSQDAMAQDGSHQFTGGLRNLPGQVRNYSHRAISLARVSYSATSCCMQTGQRPGTLPAREDQDYAIRESEAPINSVSATKSENKHRETESTTKRDMEIGGVPVWSGDFSTRKVADLIRLLPSIDSAAVPQPDPVRFAVALVLGEDSESSGGLWVSGDVTKAMNLLRWIAGDEETELVYLDNSNRVQLRDELLVAESGAEGLDRVEAALVMADYIVSHEGLLLLTQLTQGKERYLLHVGSSAPTMGGHVQVSSTMNLDLNFDSRINPRRPNGQKVRQEKPPEGFDSMVAVNPATRWLSLQNKRPVPVESVLLHELAEAHAKVALGLDYLPNAGREGAHNLAIERESRFALQRPSSGTELTSGWIRVFGAEDQEEF